MGENNQSAGRKMKEREQTFRHPVETPQNGTTGGRLLASVGKNLRIYELGKRKLSLGGVPLKRTAHRFSGEVSKKGQNSNIQMQLFGNVVYW